jgi:hypothetical protein
MEAQRQLRRSRRSLVALAGPLIVANSCCTAGEKSGSRPRSIIA